MNQRGEITQTSPSQVTLGQTTATRCLRREFRDSSRVRRKCRRESGTGVRCGVRQRQAPTAVSRSARAQRYCGRRARPYPPRQLHAERRSQRRAPRGRRSADPHRVRWRRAAPMTNRTFASSSTRASATTSTRRLSLATALSGATSRSSGAAATRSRPFAADTIVLPLGSYRPPRNGKAGDGRTWPSPCRLTSQHPIRVRMPVAVSMSPAAWPGGTFLPAFVTRLMKSCSAPQAPTKLADPRSATAS